MSDCCTAVGGFHLRNLLGNSGLHLQIVCGLVLLRAGLLYGLVVLVWKGLGLVVSRHSDLDYRLSGSCIHLLFRRSCIAPLQGVLNQITMRHLSLPCKQFLLRGV